MSVKQIPDYPLYDYINKNSPMYILVVMMEHPLIL